MVTKWNGLLMKANERIRLELNLEGEIVHTTKRISLKPYYKLERKKYIFDIRAQNLDLIELATLHKMNTDYRRRIFYEIVSSNDYLICAKRLVSLLTTKRKQEKE